ncbi:Ubiquitin-like protease domain-containing protein [Abeliophyllum distichum]|uniref:Ubiquitin-like protease domain-containing protein n=1 Tax=Abeliophyllum distichum TaxID=126358 RepID=A0ABD1RS40_9LAMI
MFETSCFGPLLKLRKIKLASQLVHQLLMRSMKTKKEEAWFKIGNKRARFGLQEFVLVTGLNATSSEIVEMSGGADCRIVKDHFKKSGGKIMKGDVYEAFKRCKRNQTDKYKLGLIIILAYVLLATEENTLIELWWFELVDDLDLFDKFPWGKLSYEYTIRIVKRDMGDKLRNSLKEGESRCRYSLHGFPLAIMIWAFEAIPNLGKKFAKKYCDGIPRMLGWEQPKRLTSSDVVTVLESKELEVMSTLIPTEVELKEVYWKELTPCVQEEDTDSESSKGDDTEHGGEPSHSFHQHSPRVSEPPPVRHDHNIADVVRMEMEKLEGRLLGVISKRLDRMEYKIDSLVEMAAVGRFHSTTSAYDSPIHNTTNVPVSPPEVKRKEKAGPNDAMDELEKERIMEDEDGEELAGGEKSAEDENVGNETEFVEKGMSGEFCTPEKLEEDENKSTKGDIVQIESTGFDIPKGRGHRTKRKARPLCSPFTDPTKRRKLSDLDVYDPYREVDPSKVDDLNKWMEAASTSDLVPLHHCDVEAKSLLDLLNKDGWLTGEIVNEALYHIRDRALKFPNLFQQDCCILDCYFCQFVQSAHGEWQIHAQSPRKEEFKFSKSLLKYVDGSIPELGKCWKDCRYLYAPCCAIGSHWFAVKIDLEDRTIFIFDSLKSHVRKAELEAFMKPLQVVIPMLMKLHVKCDDSYSTEKFKFVKMKEVPQQHNGSDCGIFTIKYIEFLQANMDVCAIQPEYIPMWRKKLAAELLAWHFEP